MKFNIAVLPGDGIGPEITTQAVNIMKAVATKFGHEINFRYADVGGAAIDKCQDPYPHMTHEVCMESDAILFGAIGDPRFDNDPKVKVRPEQGLLKMRQSLGLYANIRPVVLFSSLIDRSPLKRDRIEGCDLVCIRELTGGIYFGKPQGRSENQECAYDTCVYTKEEIKRIVTLGFEYASQRRKKLTMVDKANVLATSRLWREVTQEIAPTFPEVEVEYMFVDNAAMQLIMNPKHFDVIVTENMFGDILTDEASVISGSLGLQPSASIGIHTSLFEPIHGSYPQAAGKDIANPIATILSAAMLFEMAFDCKEEGAVIRQAVDQAIADGIVTCDIAQEGTPSYKCSEVGAYIAKLI